MLRWLTSAAKTVHDLGARYAALYWLDRVLAIASRGHVRLRHYVFVTQPLKQRAVAAETSFSVRPLASDHPVQQFPVSAAEVQRRLQQGSTCLVATSDGEFAGYLWLHLGAYPEDEVRCRFLPWPSERVAWDFDVYIVPRFRATRAFSRLWQATERHLTALGITHSASRISSYNAVSLRSHLRSGAVVTGSAIFVTIGRAQIMIAPGGVPRSTSLTWRSAPELRICVATDEQ